MESKSFKKWLLDQIQSALSKPAEPVPFIIWCDPAREWKDLLKKTCEDVIELWDEEGHELMLRHRFAHEKRRRRVIWLPIKKADITYFRVFEGEASVRELTLLGALREYGVEITRTQEDEVKEDLLAYALAKLDEPLSKWKKITPDELISAGTILQILADVGKPIDNVINMEKQNLFKRRVAADFGLPTPNLAEPEKWRVRAVARLLATDAALKLGEDGVSTSEWIIPCGNSRKRALELLEQWQRDLHLHPILEVLAGKADSLLDLKHLITDSSGASSAPLASYMGESALFENEIKQINKLENFLEVATYLARKKEGYLNHAQGFWGQWTKKKVPWDILAKLGNAAQILRENEGVEKDWHTLVDAITWYVEQGWQVDMEGESLMQEWAVEEADLFEIQKTLRKSFQTILDRTNTAFSEFAAQDSGWPEKTHLLYAGEALKSCLDENKDAAAVVVIDAFRFELGKRLARMINEGQTSPVASVMHCKAPIPTTTELGMAYALPGLAKKLLASVDLEKGWAVHTKGFDQNLAVAESRRNWLTAVYGLKPSHILTVTDAVKTGFKFPEGKLIFIYGDEFDAMGHDGVLALSGAEGYLERYAQVIRKLRDGGYGRIFLTTDHGYFHYDPGDDEILEKPEGDIRWKTRRAIVGKNLKHKTAIRTIVDGSDLECLTPRSVNAFKTYGGMGFFHRGTTLQEWLIPLVCIQWTKKAQKTGIVLKPVTEVTTQEPMVEIEPETRGKKNLLGEIDGSYLGRQITIKIRDAATGKILFKSGDIAISPKDDIRQVKLERVASAEGCYGQDLTLVVIDADNEEILATADITLKIDMDGWV